MKISKFENFTMSDIINIANNFEKEINKQKKYNSKIKLGDFVAIGKYDGKWTYYKCIDINPSVILEEKNSNKTRILTDEEYEKATNNNLDTISSEYIGNNSQYWTIEE
jgi:hypothetical protein